MATPRGTPASAGTGCPCGSHSPYLQCCGRWHRSTTGPPTAEQLMRSRFTAYAMGEAGYLLRTWDPGTRPRHLNLADGPRFTRLEVLGGEGGSMFESVGTVLFRAHYLDNGRPGVLDENSQFVRHGGEWYYRGPVPASR